MTVQIQLDSGRCEAPPGATLFDCAERLGVTVPTSCFKQGKCRECLVDVAEGQEHLSPRSPEEASLAGNFRLSCRARVTGATGLIRGHTLRRGAMRIEKESFAIPGAIVLDPAVTRGLGLAMDIGTTTVVMRLIDLESGKMIASESFENPQRFGGSDVMARIKYDGDHPGRQLQRTLLGYVKHAIAALPCDPFDIREIVVAGNTTMRDLFFGLPVETVGQRPYRSVVEHELREGKRTTTCLETPARRLGLSVHPEARVVSLPLISGHVGADAAACLLAVGMLDNDKVTAVMDIGTNTEILVGRKGKIFAASCPAGPAFEGGGIRCGMPALDGAIERVSLDADGRATLKTIGDAPAQGLCGSGLIDVLGELRRTGRMNEYGRLENGQEAFALAPGIVLSEEDISQLAQAKGANMAGLRIALEQYGVDFQQLDRFYLAGGFARHIDLAAAKRIGLIPNLPDERIVRVGNASLEGTAMALLSVTRRRALEEAAKAVRHVELETHPQFFDYFVEACQYVPVETHALQND